MMDTNRHLTLSTHARPFPIWLLSPWHSWAELNYDRVSAVEVASERAFTDMATALDKWFIAYALWSAYADTVESPDSSRFSYAVKLYIDADTVATYDDAYEQLPEHTQEILPDESNIAERVFDRRDQFQTWQTSANDMVLFRDQPSDTDAVTLLIDKADPMVLTGDKLHRFGGWSLRQCLTDALDDAPPGWHHTYRRKEAVKYLSYAHDARPSSIWVGESTHLDDVRPAPLSTRIQSALTQ